MLESLLVVVLLITNMQLGGIIGTVVDMPTQTYNVLAGAPVKIPATQYDQVLALRPNNAPITKTNEEFTFTVTQNTSIQILHYWSGNGNVVFYRTWYVFNVSGNGGGSDNGDSKPKPSTKEIWVTCIFPEVTSRELADLQLSPNARSKARELGFVFRVLQVDDTEVTKKNLKAYVKDLPCFIVQDKTGKVITNQPFKSEQQLVDYMSSIQGRTK